MSAPTDWSDFQKVFKPLLDELVLLTFAIGRIAAACDSLRSSYIELEEYIYQFNLRGLK